MQEHKCERCCKTSKGMTILTNDNNEHESICTDCFNEQMAEYYEIEDFKDYIKTYNAVDADGGTHVFNINKRIMGTGVFWEATEVNNGKFDGYQFAVDTSMDGDQHEAVQKLYAKIHKGLSKKYVEVKSYEGQKLCSISEDEIVGRIGWHSEGDETVFVIDGKEYSLKEFGEIMSSREGFNFKMQIFDPTEDID